MRSHQKSNTQMKENFIRRNKSRENEVINFYNKIYDHNGVDLFISHPRTNCWYLWVFIECNFLSHLTVRKVKDFYNNSTGKGKLKVKILQSLLFLGKCENRLFRKKKRLSKTSLSVSFWKMLFEIKSNG